MAFTLLRIVILTARRIFTFPSAGLGTTPPARAKTKHLQGRGAGVRSGPMTTLALPVFSGNIGRLLRRGPWQKILKLSGEKCAPFVGSQSWPKVLVESEVTCMSVVARVFIWGV